MVFLIINVLKEKIMYDFTLVLFLYTNVWLYCVLANRKDRKREITILVRNLEGIEITKDLILFVVFINHLPTKFLLYFLSLSNFCCYPLSRWRFKFTILMIYDNPTLPPFFICILKLINDTWHRKMKCSYY